MKRNIRTPAVAGTFYPDDPVMLDAMLTTLFRAKADDEVVSPAGLPRALIVPHASFRYSGAVAAAAYRSLSGHTFRTVIILGNAHTATFDGIAFDTHDAWQLPGGSVAVDRTTNRRLMALDPALYQASGTVHRHDHVIEVQLPFLMHLLQQSFMIVPLLFGRNPETVRQHCSEHLLSIMQGDELLVASSDLSHYPAYHDAETIDRASLMYMSTLDIEGLARHETTVMQSGIPGLDTPFCSPDAIGTVMETARRQRWAGRCLAMRNSGDADTASRDSVVGYGAIVFHES